MGCAYNVNELSIGIYTWSDFELFEGKKVVWLHFLLQLLYFPLTGEYMNSPMDG